LLITGFEFLVAHSQKMKFIFSLIIVLCFAKLNVCQQCSLVCNQQETPSDPIDPMTPLKRGKMGPKGDKGEKGSDGEKGTDLSQEVGNLKKEALKQAKKNSRLKKYVKIMNDTISEQTTEIDSLKQNKAEMNNTLMIQATEIENLQNIIEQQKSEINSTISNHTKKIELLESLLYKQAEKLELYSNTVYTIPDCSLSHIEHLNEKLPRKVPHDSTIEISCRYNYYPDSRHVTNRTCNFGNWIPNFYTHPFTCKMSRVSWDNANKTCFDLQTTLIFTGIETTEKRKEFCRKHEIKDQLWTGIVRENDRWRQPDGKLLDENFELDWYQNNYNSYNSRNSKRNDFVYIHCNKNTIFGKISSGKSYGSYSFLCEN